MSKDMQFDFRWLADPKKVVGDKMFKNVADAGYHLQKQIVNRLKQGGQTGNTYKVPGTKTNYTASAPGEVPATVTGWLAQNVVAQPTRENGVPVSYVGIRGGPNGVPYAKRLEYGFVGTDSKGRLYNQAPRPYFRSTYELEKAVIKRKLGGR